jgi:hypothetical protein
MFALAGGAHGVAYPAKSLYFHLGSPLLYDVTEGGNGECDDIYSSGCSGSLSSSFDCGEGALICNAAPGYDGPTGVGTPNGIAAFQPPAGEAGGSEGSSAGPSTTSAGGSAGAGAGGSANTSQTGAASPSKAAGPSTATGKATIKLSAFALTPSALLSLRSLRPKASELGFAFTLSAPARVRATLAKLVRVHGHNRWVSVPGALTFAAAKGRNHHHLTSRDSLAPGRYRLTLTPQNGSARSIVFQVG